MSGAYTNEPPTRGKVILHTSAGDLEIELWPKEAPLACRNFVQLAMEGYFASNRFFRIVKNFYIQTGDPSNTGLGGSSIYGAPFKDEFHSRLRFSHRGLLAMASTGPNTNKSQFFITLDEASDLNHKNTIFGKVVGNTIFNLLKLGELETVDEKPMYPAAIKGATVMANPFDEIIPRIAPQLSPAALKAQQAAADSNKIIPKRNLALLSFDAEEQTSVKPKAVLSPKKPDHPNVNTPPFATSKLSIEKRPISKALVPEEKKVPTGPSKLQEMQEKARQLASELKAMDAPAQTKKAKPAKALSSVELLRQEYLSKSRYQGPNKQERQLTEISEFSKKLKQAQAVPAAAHILPIDHNWECDLHFVKGCKSCRAADVDEEYDDKGWMQATLKFSKVADDVSVNVFKPKIDDYTVIDPRQGMKPDIFGRDLENKELWREKALGKGKRKYGQ